ncbi:MAG: hypothetical protein AAFR44_02585 [Pseudomonadota bacterium]
MFTIDLAYFAVALGGLGALATVLVVIGGVAATCPQTAPAARLGTWVVTTGFVALGLGVVALVGAMLPGLLRSEFQGLYTAVGLIVLALGCGGYVAAAMLRDILATARAAAREQAAAGLEPTTAPA